MFEIFGIVIAAMWAVEDERERVSFWFFDRENAFHTNIYALLLCLIKFVRLRKRNARYKIHTREW